MTESGHRSDRDEITSRVRSEDRDRYLATLLAPSAYQADLFTLYAFNCELNRIPFLVKEPLAGEIRLQWWRDALTGEGHGRVDANPLAAALRATCQTHLLPVSDILSMLNGCSFELSGDGLADVNALEGYLGERVSMMFRLAGLISGLEPSSELADAAGYAGVAYGLTSIMANLGQDRQHGRCFLPDTLCRQYGLTTDAILSDLSEPVIRGALDHILADLHGIAEQHYQKALDAIGHLPKENRKVFLPVALVPLRLTMLEKSRTRPFSPPDRPSQLRRQWVLFKSGLRFSSL